MLAFPTGKVGAGSAIRVEHPVVSFISFRLIVSSCNRSSVVTEFDCRRLRQAGSTLDANSKRGQEMLLELFRGRITRPAKKTIDEFVGDLSNRPSLIGQLQQTRFQSRVIHARLLTPASPARR